MSRRPRRQYVRFRPLDRSLHALMIVSFMSLAMTGLMLKFSYTSWASTFAHFVGGFEAAGLIHRGAATVMLVIFVTHLFDLNARRKREGDGTWKGMLTGPDTMLPTLKDLRDFRDTMRWFLGRGPRPAYGRWTYWEKFDYFAVFWGIAVIGTTGLMLWFSEWVTRIVPGWLLNVATIIHSDEALLATGFIFTVHFFNTHLRPEKFPMDLVVFTGRMPIEEFKRDKPLEYEEAVRSGRFEERLGEPYSPAVVRAIRIFAWCALTLGFIMIVWIIRAMLFEYR